MNSKGGSRSGKSKRTFRRNLKQRTLEDLSFVSRNVESVYNNSLLHNIFSSRIEPHLFQFESQSQSNSNIPISSCNNFNVEIVETVQPNFTRRNPVLLLKPGISLKQTNEIQSISRDSKVALAHADLRDWALENNVPHIVLNKLLNNVLRKHYPQCTFPKDARTLLNTTKKPSHLKISNNNNFCYFGIEKSLNILFEKTYYIFQLLKVLELIWLLILMVYH